MSHCQPNTDRADHNTDLKGVKMVDLEIRRLGRTEMRPKALGLGGGYLGDPDRPDSEAVETIHEAIERGINFVDTSP